ncbi:MAG: hypothetical protein Q8M07_04505 [Prosthecobacter sp.]|nr:hypothetical protein [Prosthecobacter sp.]
MNYASPLFNTASSQDSHELPMATWLSDVKAFCLPLGFVALYLFGLLAPGLVWAATSRGMADFSLVQSLFSLEVWGFSLGFWLLGAVVLRLIMTRTKTQALNDDAFVAVAA